MISYIKGSVSLISEGFIILECAGIGYKISMPASSLDKISGSEEVCVYTYMSVKDDGISLFGFMSRAERAMFELLLSVSGIGPKGALGILSSISTDELKMAIAAGDSKLIASAKGIGNKTAQKIVLELKGKVEKEVMFSLSAASQKETASFAAPAGAAEEAAEVLEALGFSRTSAVRAINSLENSAQMSAQELVSEALKIIE